MHSSKRGADFFWAGGYEVIGVAIKDGRPAVDGVQPGDRLLQVGKLRTTDATMGTIVDALRGKPGEARRLLFERDGRLFEVEAKAERLLESHKGTPVVFLTREKACQGSRHSMAGMCPPMIN